jgi:cytochrome c553
VSLDPEVLIMMKLAWVCALSAAVSGGALAADGAAGKAKVDATCSMCHEKADWAEETAPALEGMIKSIVAGKTKHKETLKLTDQEIANIAAYWAGK